MLKNFIARFRRKPAASPAPEVRSQWNQYSASDIYPEHEFAPLYPDHSSYLAMTALNAHRYDEALVLLEACNAVDAHAWTCVLLLRAHALRELFGFAEEITLLEQALSMDPDCLRAWAMRCEALYCLGRFEQAQRDFARSPHAAGYGVRGLALLGAQLAEARGDAGTAMRLYRESLEAFPRLTVARSNLGYALIRTGMHRAGYQELRRVGFETGFLPMEPGSPVWAGEPLDARPLLLVAEFGVGDMVQYLRYAGLLRQRLKGTPVWLKAPPTLTRAAQSTGWFDRVVGPEFRLGEGFHSPLNQLPLILGAESDLQPVPFPYLVPERVDAERFARLLDKTPALPLIGLCWAGKVLEVDARRSVPLATLAPILARFRRRARFVSLQLGPASEQAGALPAECRLVNLASELTDVAATVALCAHLDLVISVDTAVAHIAGASAKPLWLLARPDLDFRWETSGASNGEPVTGYYPRTRIFRHPGGSLNWAGVVAEVSAALEAWITLQVAQG